jgi:hypothetical protein
VLSPARAAVPPDVPGTSTSAVTACKQQYGSPRAYAKQVRAVMQQAMTQRCVLPHDAQAATQAAEVAKVAR